MNTEIFGFLVILLIISIVPVADAQISMGEKSIQRSVEVIINSDGNVHIKHVVASSNLPNQTELIYGTVSNISVTNEQGKEKQFSVIGDNIGVLIFPSNSDSIIEYDLEHVLLQKDNVWAASPLDVSKALAKMASSKEILKNSFENRTHYFVEESLVTK